MLGLRTSFIIVFRPNAALRQREPSATRIDERITTIDRDDFLVCINAAFDILGDEDRPAAKKFAIVDLCTIKRVD